MQWQPDHTRRGTPPTVHPLSQPATRPLREVMFGWVSFASQHSADPPAETGEQVSAPAEPASAMDEV